MEENIVGLREIKIKLERGISIPYTDNEKLMSIFHRDAIVLLILQEMSIGESVEMSKSVSSEDMRRLAPYTFPLVFTYFQDHTLDKVRVWRIK